MKMLRVKLTPVNKRAKLRLYSPTQLTSAYKACMEDQVPLYRAAKLYGVPLTTLRDRVDRRISVDTTSSGPAPVLSQLEEAKLVEHIKEMAYVGFGYTRAEIFNMATDYAIHLEKRVKEERVFSMNWFYSFIGRWPELRVVKLSSLSEQRAKSASEESLNNYFVELNRIVTKYNLKDKPQHIYKIDEKGINTEYRPQNVVVGKGYHQQTVMGERTKPVTVIRAGNALGSQIPPYFVFPGQRMLPELMEGKSYGAVVSVTQSGWSNADIFRTYLQDHFLNYVQRRDESQSILVLYDGHRSHISLDIIECANSNNIILLYSRHTASIYYSPWMLDVLASSRLSTIKSVRHFRGIRAELSRGMMCADLPVKHTQQR